jgi:hypothetical protein
VLQESLVLQESCTLEQERGDVKRGGHMLQVGFTFCSLWQINACPRRDSERLNVFDLDESEHFDFVMLFGWVTHSLTKSTLSIGNPWITSASG